MQAEHLRQQKWTKRGGVLPIVFDEGRFHLYTYERNVVVEPDQKPWKTLLEKPLAKPPKRFQKIFVPLKHYDIDTSYNNVSGMYLLGTLSRHLIGDEAHEVRSKFEEEPNMCQRWRKSTRW